MRDRFVFFLFSRDSSLLLYVEHQTKNEQVDQSNPNKEKAAITAESISQAISSVQPMDTSTSDTTIPGTLLREYFNTRLLVYDE